MKPRDIILTLISCLGIALVSLLALSAFTGTLSHFNACEFCSYDKPGRCIICGDPIPATSNRLDDIERRLSEIESNLKELDGKDYGCLLSLYVESARAIDLNGHRLDALSNRLDRIERRTTNLP